MTVIASPTRPGRRLYSWFEMGCRRRRRAPFSAPNRLTRAEQSAAVVEICLLSARHQPLRNRNTFIWQNPTIEPSRALEHDGSGPRRTPEMAAPREAAGHTSSTEGECGGDRK